MTTAITGNSFGGVALASAMNWHANELALARRRLVQRVEDAPYGDILREYFERGKMLRAFLVFAASRAVGGQPELVVVAAEAIELLHGASLFHDDIIDAASERRGLAALHQRIGVASALVVGDELLLRSFAALLDARPSHPAERILAAVEELNRLARECCRGQIDELRADRVIEEADYLAIAARKTGAPFVAAGVLGTLFGGGAEPLVAKVRAYSRHVGIAFQVGDDLLDLTAETDELGKPAGNSLERGRPMLPLIYLLRRCSQPVREEVGAIAARGWRRRELVALFEEHGVLDQVRQLRLAHLGSAVSALEGLEASGDPSGLRALAGAVEAMIAP